MVLKGDLNRVLWWNDAKQMDVEKSGVKPKTNVPSVTSGTIKGGFDSAKCC